MGVGVLMLEVRPKVARSHVPNVGGIHLRSQAATVAAAICSNRGIADGGSTGGGSSSYGASRNRYVAVAAATIAAAVISFASAAATMAAAGKIA